MPGGQRHDRRLQPRPKRRTADPLGQPSGRLGAALPATQLVGAMLSPAHADRRQLRDLMATEPPAGRALLRREPRAAAATRLRIVIDDLIDLILGPQLTTRARMPTLRARLALLPALPAHQLLRPRPRLGPPLRPRLRRIQRRRPRARAGILTRLLLQPLQTILVLLNPPRQLKNELDTRLTPRVIDRLRLGTLHTRKIRCIKQESLPQAPTTERLRKDADLQALPERPRQDSNLRPTA